MEHLNRMQIRGTVGSVRLNTVVGSKVANFSVSTDYCYKSLEGMFVCETTWHNVVCWQNTCDVDLEQIDKGCNVFVEGRLRTTRYTCSNGSEKVLYELIASRVELVKD